nr:hypothetical protein [Tanacetum cinerariifolium]
LEKAKKKGAVFIVTITKQEQEIAELKDILDETMVKAHNMENEDQLGVLECCFFIGGEGICIVAAIFGGLVNIEGSSHVCELVLAPTSASSLTPTSINRHVSPIRLPEPSENAMPYGRMRGGLVGVLFDYAYLGKCSRVPTLQHGRMILKSVENGPLLWPSIEENGVTRPKKYSELSTMKAIQADCDVKTTNIILQGLPPEEKECNLYYEFDKFAYKKGESLLHHNVYNPSSSTPQVEYAPSVNRQPNFSQPDSGLIVLVFQKGDEPIDAISHMMSFLTAVVTSRGDTLLWLLVHQEHRVLLSATTAKEKVTCQNSALNQRGKGMSHGSRIRCCWSKLKQTVKFYMRRS